MGIAAVSQLRQPGAVRSSQRRLRIKPFNQKTCQCKVLIVGTQGIEPYMRNNMKKTCPKPQATELPCPLFPNPIFTDMAGF